MLVTEHLPFVLVRRHSLSSLESRVSSLESLPAGPRGCVASEADNLSTG